MAEKADCLGCSVVGRVDERGCWPGQEASVPRRAMGRITRTPDGSGASAACLRLSGAPRRLRPAEAALAGPLPSSLPVRTHRTCHPLVLKLAEKPNWKSRWGLASCLDAGITPPGVSLDLPSGPGGPAGPGAPRSPGVPSAPGGPGYSAGRPGSPMKPLGPISPWKPLFSSENPTAVAILRGCAAFRAAGGQRGPVRAQPAGP